jgi:hypothetical protein
MSIDDLTVLSAALDPYRFDNAIGHRNGAWFAEQAARLVPENDIVHLRGLFYRIVASGNVSRPDGGLFVNDQKNWDWLQRKASKAARWLGYVPFERIRDERNEPPVLYGTDGEAISSESGDTKRLIVHSGRKCSDLPALDEMLPSLSVAHGPSPHQPFRLAFIGEKSSLGEVLRPIASAVEAELLLFSGDASETLIAGMAERASRDGRPLIVFYFADFDPGGWAMPIAVARKFQAHRELRFPNLQVQLYRVALTVDQVREFNLPSTPLKEKELRAAAWREKWGHEQTEIDALAALRPDVLDRIARDAVRPFYDHTLADRMAAGNTLPADAEKWFAALPEYIVAAEAIAAAHGPAKGAIDGLNNEHKRQVQTLRAVVEDAPDAPELPNIEIKPVITAVAPEPLFTTADSFADASRKLIDSKRLVGESDEFTT